MKTNRVVRRRYFRGSSMTSAEKLLDMMRELEKHGIDCYTSSDYENAFALYAAPNAGKANFKRHFDVVCMETADNKSDIDTVCSHYTRKIEEITGKERKEIEEMVDRLLHIAHSCGTTARSLPTAVTDDTLRPYQKEMKDRIIETWKYEPRIMLQMPTGTGKTRLFVSLINDIQKSDPSARLLIVTHRRELVEQTSRTLSEHYHLTHGVVGKGGSDSNIQIASIQKLARMKELPAADYIIIDEAHHSLAPSYRKLVAGCPSARMLGVTATPYRLRAASFKGIFGTLLLSQPVRRFINDGFLADYRLFTVSDRGAVIVQVNRLKKFGADGDYKAQDLQTIVNVDSEVEKLYDYYKACADGRQGLVYAVNCDHAARIAAMFNRKGIRAVSLDCNTPADERKRIVREFKTGDSIKIMVNVELFTEGFDCPDIEFVMLARPTRSLAMYLQQVGRALRPFSTGKNETAKVVIIDAAGLYNRFGLPERRRDWERYFIGERPQGEDYNSRPLGTPGIDGLIKEVTGSQINCLNVRTYGDYLIGDFGGGKLGVCDVDGRMVFPLYYKHISSYAAGWLVGKRQGDGKDMVVDLLIPQQRRSLTFLDFAEEGNGIYSVGVTRTGRLRFDNRLHLLPTSSRKLGGRIVYQFGDNLYTLSLLLGTKVYTNLTRYVSGLVILTDSGSDGITMLCRGEIYNLPIWHAYNAKHFFSDDNSLHIYTDGTVFRRITDYPVLYQASRGNGVALCDKHLNPLCQGDYLETAPGHCTIYKDGKPFQTVSFVDYLCCGMR